MDDTSTFDLVIFDCDGVLVDSEMLSAKVLMKQLSEIDIHLTFDEFREIFFRSGFADCNSAPERQAWQILARRFSERNISNDC